MKYWLFNAEQDGSLPCDAADIWFRHGMGFSATIENDTEQLRKRDLTVIAS